MQQWRHAIVAQRASPLRPTSRLKARHLFFGVFKKRLSRLFLHFIVSYGVYDMSYIVWVYTVDKTPYVVTLNNSNNSNGNTSNKNNNSNDSNNSNNSNNNNIASR